jgi:hypothetical protein
MATISDPVQQSQTQEPNPLSTTTSKNANNYQYTRAGQVPQASLQSPQRYEFDYGVQPSALSQSSTQWNGTNGDQPLFSPTSTTDQSLYGFSPYPSLEVYQGYEPAVDLAGGLGGLPSSPTSTAYPTSLPFRGLDYIRNYNPNGYGANEQDSLWQSYDPGAFGYDPDLPFTLGDTTNELHDTVPQS